MKRVRDMLLRHAGLISRSVSVWIVVALATTAGCTDKTSRMERRREVTRRLQTLQSEVDNLYRRYLTSDIASARAAITQAVWLLRSFEPAGVAEEALWLGYARLYVIEMTADNEDLAKLYYEKARYGLMINLEMRGVPPAEIVQRLASFTPEACREAVLTWDKTFTEGQGPRFLSDAPEQR